MLCGRRSFLAGAPPRWRQAERLGEPAVERALAGEADQAAPLLKLVDSSPYFKDSGFQVPIIKAINVEMFRIRAMRRPR